MIGRAASMLSRQSHRTRGLTVAAVGLLVLVLAASALAPSPRPSRGSRRQATWTTRSIRKPARPPSDPQVAAGELDGARRVAGRFLAGYLPVLYGSVSASAVEGPASAVRSQLTGSRALLTPVERRRHPRLISLGTLAQASGVVLATALITDGGVTTFALRIIVQ
jgi:hypothetical protein